MEARAIAFHVEAKLHAFRKTQEGVVVSFVISPIDMPSQLALDPLGTRYMLALAAIGDDEQPVSSAAAAPAAERPVAPEGDENRGTHPSVKRAGMLANDPGFQAWVHPSSKGMPRAVAKDMAATHIRRLCEIRSRRELATNETARQRFEALEDRYRRETGLAAEQRG